MMTTNSNMAVRFSCAAIILLALIGPESTFAQKPAAKGARSLVFAANEGAAGNVDADEIARRYAGLKLAMEKATRSPISLVAVRDATVLRNSLQTGSYALVMSRPVDPLAEAVRDYGYRPVVVAKEPSQALFIVPRDSPIRTLAQVQGKSIVTPDRYSWMWRVAAATMRDNNLSLTQQNARSMRDQAAIGSSLENGFFEVGVVASYSGVGRNWEKKGGRVIGRSRDLPNMPLIASPKFAAAQIGRLRVALIALDSSPEGAAILKEIGVTGFKEAEPAQFLDLLKWLGELEKPKQ